MKTFKLIACLVTIVAALAYAGLPPVGAGGLLFKGMKAAGTITNINGWIVISGFDMKTTLQLDKMSPAPAGQNIIIQQAKAFKASRKDAIVGSFSNIIYGTFVAGAEGDLTQLTLNDPVAQLGKSFALQLKGVTVGTVIAKKCAPKADNIKNALLTEIKALKGVAVTAGGKAPLGVLGGVTGDMGWLGVSPAVLALAGQIPATSDRIAKATGKGGINQLNIYAESIPAVNGKAKASLSTKIMNGTHALAAGTGTNSLYKIGKGLTLTYDLTKP